MGRSRKMILLVRRYATVSSNCPDGIAPETDSLGRRRYPRLRRARPSTFPGFLGITRFPADRKRYLRRHVCGWRLQSEHSTKGRSPMKKLLSLLVVAALLGLNTGCSETASKDSKTTKKVETKTEVHKDGKVEKTTEKTTERRKTAKPQKRKKRRRSSRKTGSNPACIGRGGPASASRGSAPFRFLTIRSSCWPGWFWRQPRRVWRSARTTLRRKNKIQPSVSASSWWKNPHPTQGARANPQHLGDGLHGWSGTTFTPIAQVATAPKWSKADS